MFIQIVMLYIKTKMFYYNIQTRYHNLISLHVITKCYKWVTLKKCHQNRWVPQNAYSLKLKSIKRTILYIIYSTKEPILGFFLLFNFHIDSAQTFSSGIKFRNILTIICLGEEITSNYLEQCSIHKNWKNKELWEFVDKKNRSFQSSILILKT